MTPKYSIIVPAHNSASFIQKCLNSIEDQVFDPEMYELIVVCDSCEDNTDRVAYQYANQVLHVDFRNDGPTRQAGVDVARGEWILFLDDDDYWLHEYVLQLIDQNVDEDTDMLCFGFIFKGIGYAEPVRYSLGLGRKMFWPSVWNKCYKKSFIEDTPFHHVEATPDGQAADIEWTNRLLQKPFSYKTLNQPLYYYNYMRAGSQTMTKVKI